MQLLPVQFVQQADGLRLKSSLHVVTFRSLPSILPSSIGVLALLCPPPSPSCAIRLGFLICWVLGAGRRPTPRNISPLRPFRGWDIPTKNGFLLIGKILPASSMVETNRQPVPEIASKTWSILSVGDEAGDLKNQVIPESTRSLAFLTSGPHLGNARAMPEAWKSCSGRGSVCRDI